MNERTSSRYSLALLAMLGIAVGCSLVAATYWDGPVATPAPGIGMPAPAPPIAPRPKVPSQPPASDEPTIDLENYSRALFEISCARARIEDTRLLRATIDEVHARYGWDDASFRRAQATGDADALAHSRLREQMMECTPELAMSFAPRGYEDSASDRSWVGGYVDDEIRGGGIVSARVRISVDDQGRVRAAFQGKRDGKGFSIPLKGEFNDENGKFSATGTRGPDTARIAGRYDDGRLVGRIQGAIQKRGFRLTFAATDRSATTSTDPPQESDDVAGEVWKAASLADYEIAGAGLTDAKLRLKVRSDGKVTGSFQGKRDGKGFSIPLSGTIHGERKVMAAGNRGPNNVRLSGWYKSARIDGALQGSINRKGYRVNFNAE